MKYPYVHIENFMGIGTATVDLADKGLVLIEGVNEDDTSTVSNGAAKSTLPDALAWCFYGCTRKVKNQSLAADSVVNRTAGKNTHVTAHAVEDDGSYYIVERWRKKLYKGKRSGCALTHIADDGTPTDLTKGTDKLTQVEIDKALGATEEVFMAAVYAAQENLPDLPALTDTELKKLIEEASGITLLVRAYEIAKQRLKDANSALDTWRLDHVRLEGEVRNIQARIADLKSRVDGYEEKRKLELASLTNDFNSARDRARRAQVKRDDINVVNVETKMAELDLKIASVAKQQTEEDNLSIAWTEATSRLMTGNTLYTQLVKNAQAMRVDLDNVNGLVGSPCGSCGKPYKAEDLSKARELATEKLRLEVEKAKEQRKDVEDLATAEKTAKDALEAFRKTKPDIHATVEERKRLATLLVERANAERDMTQSIAEAQRLKAAIETKRTETNPFTPLIEKANEELSETLKAHRDSEVQGVTLEKAVMVAKDVVKVYGPAGVRAHILDTVTPFLNQRTSDYLGAMSDGNISAIWSTIQLNAKGELTEKFAISVDKPGDADSFIGLSGGEKRKVRLACALALQDLVASRATKPIDLWIGDEIDHALDEAGLERLMNVLENKARERGTVLVISHNSLRDWIRETATVTRKAGMSTIAGAISTSPIAMKVAA